ncbi:MAG: tetratricopeptide repeat protein [Limisphaerales bacterium]
MPRVPARNKLIAGICIVLAVVTLILYWPVKYHDFVNYDDPGYILDNSHVTPGVTWPGIVWAFQSGYAANWHPLTWISHMLDCQFYGLNPAGHHLTNVLFHIANTLLLFLLLNQLTGALWRGAFVAAFFAWHPLHVESVAWAAERKDVLSAFFWMLTLMAYTRYAQSRSKIEGPESGVKNPPLNPPLSTLNYFLALFFFACGLMSKPMVVTLPFVLLLLDFWPLKRIEGFKLKVAGSENPNLQPSTFNFQPFICLIAEKIPFFLLAAIGSAITFFVQKNAGAFWSAASLPIHSRLANAVIAYVRYISKTFWPSNLALIYPYPKHWPIGLVIGAALFLTVWTALFIMWARRRPYLIVGWLWFLGTLFPTIGLVQVGIQSIADRYMYLPSIGLFILIVWGANDLLERWPEKKYFSPLAGGMALIGCLLVASIQLTYWQNSLKLFSHTVAVTTDNYPAYNCLGNVLEKMGRKNDAFYLYSESVRIEPDYPLGQFNLGMMLLEKGEPDKAFVHLNRAVQLMPKNPDMQYDLAVFLSKHGKPDEAIGHFKAALKDKPDFPEARRQLDQILKTKKVTR